MNFKATFKETDHSFVVSFSEFQTASDGGYDRGYEKGYEDGHADGTSESAEQISDRDELIKGIVERSLTELTADMLTGVSVIGGYSFYGMQKLKNVVIPDSVTTIGGAAFSTSFVNAVTIGSGIKRIEYTAFYNCRSLTNVTVDGDLTYIGEQAFQNCTSAQEFDFSHCTAVPKLNRSNAFSGTPASCVIKVPASLLDEWKASTNWSAWADRIVGV